MSHIEQPVRSVIHPQPVRDPLPANAVWYFPAAQDAAAQIKDFVAFWRGVTGEE
jgi:uncharacterized protein (DUF427 family)